MRSRQTGLTFLGLLVLVLVVGTWVYAGIRLAPIYLEYMKVAGTMDKVHDQYDSNPETTEWLIRKAFEYQFNIDMVNVINENDIIIKREGDTFHVTANYEETAPFAFNVYLLVTFNKTVDIKVR